MAEYRNLTNIDITLQTAGTTRLGFGTPLFASAHRYFPERVRSYTSLTAAAEDLPTDSNAYKAVKGYFSLTPSPSVVKVGRREADLELTVAQGATKASFALSVFESGQTYKLNIEVEDAADESAVASQIVSQIEGDSDLNSMLTVSNSGGTINIDVANSIADFYVQNLSDELSENYNTTESASELLSELSEEDGDFYFFSCDDHSEQFVLEAAADIEARLKMYFVSVQNANTLSPYTAGSATDIAGKIVDSAYDRTKVFFHHEADTLFPETYHIASSSVYDAGSVLWANVSLPVSISQSPVRGKALSSTEKTYLEQRNVSYVERSVGTGVVADGNNLRNNRVASGEWISNIRGRDNLQVDLEAEYMTLLLSQKGGKIPFTDEGIALLKNTCRNVLERYVLRNFIKPTYKLNFLTAAQSSVSDKQQGVYTGGSFQAELQGGILFVDVSGNLSLNLG